MKISKTPFQPLKYVPRGCVVCGAIVVMLFLGGPVFAGGPFDTAAGESVFERAPGDSTLLSDLSFGLNLSRLAALQAESDEAKGGEPEDEEFKDNTGTDPRDFTSKFMPYYRYTELKNGVQVHDWTAFGFIAFTPRFGMTFEVPLRYMDISDALPDFPRFLRPPPRLSPSPLPGLITGRRISGGLDDTEFGLGDSIFRVFFRPEALEWTMPCTFGPRKGEDLNWSFMPLIETTVPTNTDDILGEDSWILSPGFAIAGDTPTYGFIAAMLFYDFSTIKDTDEVYTSRFRARIYLMQPLSKPGPDLFDGFYLLPEFQPVYDFREDHFSFWIGPEIGKVIMGDTQLAIYAKPGWGIDPNEGGDREFTVETGIRIFFN